MDVVLGIIVFFVAFIIFYTLLGSNENTKATVLKQEAGTFIEQIISKDNPIRIVDGSELNVTKLGNLKNSSYGDLKRSFRISGDFCIFLEDDKGNIVLINQSYRGIGSSNINISGVPCSQK